MFVPFKFIYFQNYRLSFIFFCFLSQYFIYSAYLFEFLILVNFWYIVTFLYLIRFLYDMQGEQTKNTKMCKAFKNTSFGALYIIIIIEYYSIEEFLNVIRVSNNVLCCKIITIKIYSTYVILMLYMLYYVKLSLIYEKH